MSTSIRSWLEVALDWRRPEAERISAIVRLGEQGDPSVVLPLGLLYSESGGRLRSVTAESLDRLSAVEVLARLLRNADGEQRLVAVQALGALGAPTALPSLLSALADPVAKVREFAASALLTLRDERALPELVRCLSQDPDPDVRGAAAQALGELDRPEAQEALERAAAQEPDPFTVILIERSLYRFTERAAA